MVTATGNSSSASASHQTLNGGGEGTVTFQPAPSFEKALSQLSTDISHAHTSSIDDVGPNGDGASDFLSAPKSLIHQAETLSGQLNSFRSDIPVYLSSANFLNSCNLLLSNLQTAKNTSLPLQTRNAAWSAVETGAKFLIGELEFDPNLKSVASSKLLTELQSLQQLVYKSVQNPNDPNTAKSLSITEGELGLDGGNHYNQSGDLGAAYEAISVQARAAQNDIINIAGGKQAIIDGKFDTSFITSLNSVDISLLNSTQTP